MGDVVLAASVFEYLKSTLPTANLWFATDRKYAGLFSADPRLARVVAVDKGGEREAAAVLSGAAWSRIIDLQNSRRSFLCGRTSCRWKRHRSWASGILSARCCCFLGPVCTPRETTWSRAMPGHAGSKARRAHFPRPASFLTKKNAGPRSVSSRKAGWSGRASPCFRSARGRTRSGPRSFTPLWAGILPQRDGTCSSPAGPRTLPRPTG